MSCWAVIVAAGRGTRAGLGQNKVFQPLEGRTVLARCLDAFERCGRFDGIALVLSPEDEGRFDELTRREGPFPLVKRTARGGATRRDSVYNGLMALPEDAQIVAIHDAARPFVTGAVIDATLESARRHGSGVISTTVVVPLWRQSRAHACAASRTSLSPIAEAAGSADCLSHSSRGRSQAIPRIYDWYECVCTLMRPGNTKEPRASMNRSASISGQSGACPMQAIIPSSNTMNPSRSTSRREFMVTMVALKITVVCISSAFHEC